MKKVESEKTSEKMAEEADEWRKRQKMVARCLYCPWTFEGTVEKCAERWAAHQRRRHGDRSASSKRRLTSAQQRELAMERSQWRREAAAAAARGEL